ncbi:MAG: hypothetical protein IT331_07675 [Anaerolineae bacterium]|nr:hypothetical protein [Anaerolineae bacterium]
MLQSIWRGIGILAFANAAALVLQFLTTVLMARAFGAGAAMDAYTLAIFFPEALQYLLMLVTLSVVFTPMFIDARTRLGDAEAWSIAVSLLLIVAAVVLVLIPALAAAMPWIIVVMGPGMAPATQALAGELTTIILPGLVYFATAGILLGICYAYQDFVTAAVNTLLLALLNLTSFFVFVSWLDWGVRGMMLGRMLALLILQLFLVLRVRAHKRGIALKWRVWHPQTWLMLTYLPPYMFGSISWQIGQIAIRSLLSTLGAGTLAAWGYGQRLADIPMGVLGTAVGTTYVPLFSSAVASARYSEARRDWSRAVWRMLLVLTPFAVLLVVGAAPLIQILLERGAFDAQATQMTAAVLIGLSLGLPLRGVGGLVVRGLPAFKTRLAPILLSALSIGASVGGAFLLANVWGLFGIAFAVSLGDALFAIAGLWFFWRRLAREDAPANAALPDLPVSPQVSSVQPQK